MKVLSNEGTNENDILMDLTQHYTFKVGGAEKTVRSLVTLQRDGTGKITLHEEEWDHEPNKVIPYPYTSCKGCGVNGGSTLKMGFWGRFRRRGNVWVRR